MGIGPPAHQQASGLGPEDSLPVIAGMGKPGIKSLYNINIMGNTFNRSWQQPTTFKRIKAMG
jgi:hypothetical protein